MSIRPVAIKEFTVREANDFQSIDRGNPLLNGQVKLLRPMLERFPALPSPIHQAPGLEQNMGRDPTLFHHIGPGMDEYFRRVWRNAVEVDIQKRLNAREQLELYDGNKFARIKVIEHAEALQSFVFNTIFAKHWRQIQLLKNARIEAKDVADYFTEQGHNIADQRRLDMAKISRAALEEQVTGMKENSRIRREAHNNSLSQYRLQNAEESSFSEEKLRVFREQSFNHATVARELHRILAAQTWAAALIVKAHNQHAQNVASGDAKATTALQPITLGVSTKV